MRNIFIESILTHGGRRGNERIDSRVSSSLLLAGGGRYKRGILTRTTCQGEIL